MMKRHISCTVMISIVFLCLSCTTPQDVLNDYNKHFEKTPAVTQDILDTGNAHLMLQELYKVDIEHTLILTAPLGCESYSWKITDIGGQTTYIAQANARLSMYIPKTIFYEAVRKSEGKSRLYGITLTVKYKGKIYSDTAVLVLYVTG